MKKVTPTRNRCRSNHRGRMTRAWERMTRKKRRKKRRKIKRNLKKRKERRRRRERKRNKKHTIYGQYLEMDAHAYLIGLLLLLLSFLFFRFLFIFLLFFLLFFLVILSQALVILHRWLHRHRFLVGVTFFVVISSRLIASNTNHIRRAITDVDEISDGTFCRRHVFVTTTESDAAQKPPSVFEAVEGRRVRSRTSLAVVVRRIHVDTNQVVGVFEVVLEHFIFTHVLLGLLGVDRLFSTPCLIVDVGNNLHHFTMFHVLLFASRHRARGGHVIVIFNGCFQR